MFEFNFKLAFSCISIYLLEKKKKNPILRSNLILIRNYYNKISFLLQFDLFI